MENPASTKHRQRGFSRVGNDFEFWLVSQIQLRPSFLLDACHVQSLWPSLTSYLDLMSIAIKFSIFFRIFSSKVGPFGSLFLPKKKKKHLWFQNRTFSLFCFVYFFQKNTFAISKRDILKFWILLRFSNNEIAHFQIAPKSLSRYWTTWGVFPKRTVAFHVTHLPLIILHIVPTLSLA